MKKSKELKSHYVYRHVRLDKNEVFYIGVGTKFPPYNTEAKEYSRAYSKRNRNKIWKSIVKKTDYSIEILFESTQYPKVLKKEIELIKKYGRRDLKSGTLSNLTNGGEGSLGRINPNGGDQKPVDMYSIDGNYIKSFKSIKEASNFVNLKSKSNIITVCKGIKFSAGGYKWTYKDQKLKNRLNLKKNLSEIEKERLRKMSNNRLGKRKNG